VNKPLAASLALALFGVGCVLATGGYKSYHLFRDSQGSSEHEVHLDRAGAFSLTANPPGRSCLRPGGVLEVRLTETAQTLSDVFVSGTGTVRVTDRSGTVCLQQAIEALGVGSSSRGRFLAFPQEFDTSRGGPYQIEFKISEPFGALAGIPQTLSVHHFVCGNEAIIHLAQFGGSALLLATSGFFAYKWLLTKRVQ